MSADADPNDINKPLTSLEDVMNRFKNPELFSNETPDKHQTKWTLRTFKEFINFGNENHYWNFLCIEEHERDDQVGNGFLIAYRKVK